MGQYFKPVILAENKKTVLAFMYSHDYGNGLKLMEHSYIGNNFVSAFETRIKNNPQRVVWAGDYADKCKGLKTNVYGRCKEKLQINPKDSVSTRESRYVVNHTKKEFVDKFNVFDFQGCKGTKIHPLPLLTCEGNGQGGGDFNGSNPYVGIWARDLISVESKKPKGYKEFTPNFVETN